MKKYSLIRITEKINFLLWGGLPFRGKGGERWERKFIFPTFLVVFITISMQNFCFATKPKIVATASMLSDMVKNIGGDYFEVVSIVPIGGDPHIYKPKPRDVRLALNADLIIKNGLTFEGWLNELIANSGTKAEVVLATANVKPIESLTYANSSDPHAWMDVGNGLIYISNIKNALLKLAPEHAAEIEKNYAVYKKQLEELDAYIVAQVKTIPEKSRILITSHDAFQYYGRRYGLRLESIIGTSTDAEAQTSDIMRLTKAIKENDVKAVFVESTINPKLIKQIASDNGVSIGGELFADSIGEKGGEGDSYYKMIKHNTAVIVAALKGGKKEVEGATIKKEEGESNGNNMWLYGILGLLFLGGFFFVFRSLNK